MNYLNNESHEKNNQHTLYGRNGIDALLCLRNG